MDAETIMMVVVAVVFGYLVLVNRIAKFILPLRLEIAELGEELKKEPAIPLEMRKRVDRHLDRLMDPWVIVFDCLLVPFMLINFMIKRPTDKVASISDDDVRNDYTRFMFGLAVSQAAANPAFGLLFILEALILVPLMALAGRSIKGYERLFTNVMSSPNRVRFG